MFHWDISVAFTNAKAEEENYFKFPDKFPEDLFPGYKAETIARLKRNPEKLLCSVSIAAKIVMRS